MQVALTRPKVKVVLPRGWVYQLKRYLRKNLPLFILMLPGLIHIAMIQYAPMFGLIIAFKDYKFKDGIFGSKWVGFENFHFLLGSGVAWRITLNTLLMNALFIISGTLVTLTLAIMLSEIYYTSRLTQIYQLTLFLPFFVGTVVIGYIAYAFLGPSGFLNTLLESNGLAKVNFYLEKDYWRPILVLANLWSGVGVGTIIYLSGIISINPEFYEAAQMDGATKLQQIIHITIPLIRYLIVIQVLLAIGRIFFANFGLFYFVPQIYKNGALLPVVDVIDTFVYRALQGGSYGTGTGNIVKLGMAAAAGFYQSVVGLILVVLANLTVRRLSKEHALF